jgi:methylglutaconyl-CoA hydratase
MSTNRELRFIKNKRSLGKSIITTELRGAIAVLTIDRQRVHNALDSATLDALRTALAELTARSDVSVIVITGAGERAFVAGGDLTELSEPRGVGESFDLPMQDVFEEIARSPKPTIAAINGMALGGGLELALACDFRLAAEAAVMGLSEVRLGIMPGAGGTQRLSRLVGVARAKELVLTGRRIDAGRALEIGLVSRVVPAAELRRAGQELADELAACAPLSVAMAKRAIDEGASLPLGDALALERRCYDVTLMSEDRNEGLRAFAEKRPPRFTGR